MSRVRRGFAALRKMPGRRLSVLGLLLLAVLIGLGVRTAGLERLALAERAYAQQVSLAQAIGSVQANAVAPSATQFSTAWLNSSAIAAGLSVQGLDFNLEHIQFSARGDGPAVVQWLHRLEQEGGKIVSLSLERIGQALEVRMSLQAPKVQVHEGEAN